MLTRDTQPKRRKLTRELLALIVTDAFSAMVAYFLFRSAAGTLAYEYCARKNVTLDELETVMLDSWIFNLSLLGAMIVFVVLFLISVGRKLSYIREVTDGIDALRTHRMNHEIPLKGNNELTELAASINQLAETERQLKAAEQQLQEERTALIRGLSHDIRTPLTAILSYTEYMQGNPELSREQIGEFLDLMQKKGEQIKGLTDQLLDSGARQMTVIEDGRFLMEQLGEEWLELLEEDFQCEMNLSDCPAFSGEYDIQALRRIFDNLASNIEKYADPAAPVCLEITSVDAAVSQSARGTSPLPSRRIVIKQFNQKATEKGFVESRKIGLESIRRIAETYGGSITVQQDEKAFAITITLFAV